MHKQFYASGFIYDSLTQQILLQQLINGNNVNLELFYDKSQRGHDPQVIFQHCIQQALGISVKSSSIHLVYDYIHDRLGEQFIYYVEALDITPKSFMSKNKTEWLLISKLSKYRMSEQTRHDIIVGQRVIRSLMDTAPSLHAIQAINPRN